MWIMLNGRVKGFENSHLQQQSLLIILCSNDNRGKLCSCTYQHPASEFLNWCSYRIFAINRRFSEYVDGKVLHYSWIWLVAMKNAKLKHEKKIYIFVLFIPHRCVREERKKTSSCLKQLKINIRQRVNII